MYGTAYSQTVRQLSAINSLQHFSAKIGKPGAQLAKGASGTLRSQQA
jgi:hypothetical protein